VHLQEAAGRGVREEPDERLIEALKKAAEP
jgi:hypothetical protein